MFYHTALGMVKTSSKYCPFWAQYSYVMPLDRVSLATTKQNRDVYRDGWYI